ncbi:hypothetical protein GH714_011717 [Hevea brasiliensis]|uniref:Uncharacterized protein n=1 Tax=Hevea brasiliensis TaxID=3981 RepID=A0A6A6MIJ1_HEVBR|nr:hypothetical protein GH714_011717 [Hevea brasiliensis]
MLPQLEPLLPSPPQTLSDKTIVLPPKTTINTEKQPTNPPLPFSEPSGYLNSWNTKNKAENASDWNNRKLSLRAQRALLAIPEEELGPKQLIPLDDLIQIAKILWALPNEDEVEPRPTGTDNDANAALP